MKYLSYFMVALAISFNSCQQKSDSSVSKEAINNPISAEGEVDPDELPAFKFEKEIYEFGSVTSGEKITYSFKFRNVGKTDMIISNASASCGCTVPKWPEDPIEPGEEGSIDVVFDTEGKTGIQSKSITVVANTIPNTKVLYLRGEVKSLTE